VSGAGGLFYDRYSTAGHQEWLMRIGPSEGMPILFVPPLLEEMNRTRAFLATVMRLLAAKGFACWLMDLPRHRRERANARGVQLGGVAAAVADASAAVAKGRHVLTASLRGGALLDDAAAGASQWRFAPAEGSSLARDLLRASMLKPDELKEARIELAGYRLSDTLFAELSAAKPVASDALRTVRLASDRADAALKVEGPALWRRSEPGNSPDLAVVLADDIADWGQRCAVS
jgi:hypothetical protein